jgi:deoxyribodipyrimidine photo-lyase
MNKSIFIFRRDFSIIDNISFINCYNNSNKILPIFIFTPTQITSKNKYFSSNSFQFMIESLEWLNNELENKYNSKLHFYYGENIDVLNKLLKKYNFNSIYYNLDYTNYAKNRDIEIKEFCEKNNIKVFIYENYLLNKIGTYLKEDKTEYEKFTPFKINAMKFPVSKPIIKKYNKIKFDKINYSLKLKDFNKFYTYNNKLALNGGRDNALNILKNIKQFKDYDKIRNILTHNTTNLSPYIKFGCVSIREVYYSFIKNLGKNNGLITQLFWREFYYYLVYYNSRILLGKSLKEKYNKIKWKNNKIYFKSWCNAKTGFPIVDAGMRELNETGYMHNRARLITSNVLIKILNCDWRLGEKYFSNKLVDYDPSVNNGNWQWSSGSGADSQPFFRIMSIKRQTENFDPECLYIKKWIPELSNVPPNDIINWDTQYIKYKNINYPKPIVNYIQMRKEILKVYTKALYE